MLHLVLFLIFAALCVGGAVNLLVQRHPINSALSLVLVTGSLALIYLLLGAEFVAAIQIIIYAGAVMVLFIFVIMLLNLPREDVPWARRDLRRIMLALVLAGILLVELILVVGVRLAPGAKAPAVAAGFGTTEMVGRLLFSRFLFPFEITSVILLVAIIGALVLAKKHFS